MESDSRWLEAYLDAAASLLELPLAPEYREGILLHFMRLASFASEVAAHPLAIEDEPAPAFWPDKVE